MDVIVIGAGVIGGAVARAFSRSGADVAVLDAAPPRPPPPPAARATCWSPTRAPVPNSALAQRSIGLWRDLAVELAEELGPAFPSIEYEPKGGIVVATTDAGAVALREFAATQRPAGVAADELTVAEARRPRAGPDPARPPRSCTIRRTPRSSR